MTREEFDALGVGDVLRRQLPGGQTWIGTVLSREILEGMFGYFVASRGDKLFWAAPELHTLVLRANETGRPAVEPPWKRHLEIPEFVLQARPAPVKKVATGRPHDGYLESHPDRDRVTAIAMQAIDTAAAKQRAETVVSRRLPAPLVWSPSALVGGSFNGRVPR